MVKQLYLITGSDKNRQRVQSDRLSPRIQRAATEIYLKESLRRRLDAPMVFGNLLLLNKFIWLSVPSNPERAFDRIIKLISTDRLARFWPQLHCFVSSERIMLGSERV